MSGFKKGQIVRSPAGVVRLVQIHACTCWKAVNEAGGPVIVHAGDIAAATPGQVQDFVDAVRALKRP